MRISTPPAGAAHRLYLSQLSDYLHNSEQIQTAWEHYCAEHSDPETHQPFDDDAYGRRQSQRAEATLAAFGRVYYHADELVSLAEQQLLQLPASDRTRHYAWRLVLLNVSTQRLYEARDAWLDDRHKLPEAAVPGNAAYEEPLAEFHAKAWLYLHQWTFHGRSLIEINQLAQKEPHASPAPAKAPPVPEPTAKPSAPRR
ncbi:hypothetical protein A6A06_01615 [Streptomyces sp. CB02923]|uniref:hypothetical protein n=1 Tax=Streptomyces sp. CB02923 TaxID=1718985 RepID=UPI00093B37E9|nr:hypothetical protein [Streptomyces sp. CB02923]OKI09430.1 hypothetical protein A6A06_01615 [Streptomyces sp. CB02923]